MMVSLPSQPSQLRAGRAGGEAWHRARAELTEAEVIGAVAVALNYLGLKAIFECTWAFTWAMGLSEEEERKLTGPGYFRFQFADVLESLLPYKPLIENPHEAIHHIETRLKADSIDHLILSSCASSSLPVPCSPSRPRDPR